VIACAEDMTGDGGAALEHGALGARLAHGERHDRDLARRVVLGDDQELPSRPCRQRAELDAAVFLRVGLEASEVITSSWICRIHRRRLAGTGDLDLAEGLAIACAQLEAQQRACLGDEGERGALFGFARDRTSEMQVAAAQADVDLIPLLRPRKTEVAARVDASSGEDLGRAVVARAIEGSRELVEKRVSLASA
jgi:hypothetical protein